MLEVKKLTVKYRKHIVFENLSFNVKNGDLLLVKGNNGAGKTTLCNCLCGLIPNSIKAKVDGQIILYGQDITNLKINEICQSVGIVFQNPDSQVFMPKVEDEIVFAMENLCYSRLEMQKRLNEILLQLKINHLKNENPEKLSAGEKQKVAIASILALDPKVIIFDEVFKHLDKDSVLDIIKIINDLKKLNKIIVVVEHSNLVEKLADKVMEI